MRMRSVFAAGALMTVLAAVPAFAEGVPSYSDALSQAKQKNLNILIDFSGEH